MLNPSIMKKFILFYIVVFLATNLSAQEKIKIPANIRNISVKKPVNYLIDNANQQGQNTGQAKNIKSTTSIYDEYVGETQYDWQTNSSMSNRCYLYPDATVGLVWIHGLAPPTFPNRGTGYNYFNGSSWDFPVSPIEPFKTGWPSYTHLGNNGEVVIAHSDADLIISKRTTKGTGSWAISTIPSPGLSPKWASATVSGSTVHILTSLADTAAGGPLYMGQNKPILYYRSQDEGVTWDIQAQVIPGLDAASGYTQGFGSDCYSWAEPMGDTIAFVAGNSWTDLILMKSTDGGTTWSKTFIFRHPYPDFNETTTLTTDTPYACDGRHAVGLDSYGNAHVAFGIMRVDNSDTTDGITSYFPATDGLAYWKEGEPFFNNLDPDVLLLLGNLIAWVQDADGSGILFDSYTSIDNFPRYGANGLTSQPQISIDTNNDIYVVYTSPVENMVSAQGQFFTHIWARKFSASQNSWGNICELTHGVDYDGIECVYPAMSKTMDSCLRIVYQYDMDPGAAITGDFDPYGTNYIMCLTVSKDSLTCNFNCRNISGKVYYDTNGNGIPDTGENGIAGHLVKADPGNYYATTDNNGIYWFYLDSGNYTITYLPQQFWEITSDSATYSVSITSNDLIPGFDFGVKIQDSIQEVGISVIGGGVTPGFSSYYWLFYKNFGSQTMSGSISFEYSPVLNYVGSMPTEDDHTGNILTYNYDTLASLEQRIIFVEFVVTPDVQLIGDTILSQCSIGPVAGDLNPENNYDFIEQIITGSYDPNDKSVSPLGVGSQSYVLHGEKLTYTIRFQNTGTDTAFTVFIIDTVDTDLNMETFCLLASSHPVTHEIYGTGIIKFRFNNILLPDSNVNEPASHGFIKYSIEPKTGLSDNTEVTNEANIFFDFNPPVLTNEVLSTYVTEILRVNKVTANSNAIIYPNPASGIVTLLINSGHSAITTFNIYNITGNLVMSEKTSLNLHRFNVNRLSNGVYLIEIKSGGWTERHKLVIQR